LSHYIIRDTGEYQECHCPIRNLTMERDKA
jgi:hypothetical protein